MSGLGWATEAAPSGGMDAVQKLIEQRMQMARDAEVMRANMAHEQLQRDTLAENTAYRHDAFGAQQADRDITTGVNLGKSLSPGDDVTALAPRLAKGGQGPNMAAPAYDPMTPAAPPASLADPAQDQAAPMPSLTGGGPYVPNAPSLDSPNVTPRIKWLGTPQERQTLQKQQDADAFVRGLPEGSPERLDAEYQNKMGHPRPASETVKPMKLSAAGTSALRALEGAGPLTDQALTMMEQQFPGIADNREKYNGNVDKLKSLYHAGKYWAGFSDPADPRQQLISLLKPIQAGQYTQSSRSYKMVQLALEHMADMSQTPARQYEAMASLRALMPELREGVIRAESPIDPTKPLSGSYFDRPPSAAPPSGGAPPPGPPPSGAPQQLPPKEQRTIGMPWTLPGGRPVIWTAAGWADAPPPRPNAATPAPAGVANVPPLDTNRLPETGALAAPAPRLLNNRISPDGTAALQKREGGFYGDPYDDSGTGQAIGYGMHTWQGQPVTSGLHVEKPDADAEMDRQIKQTYGPVVDRALRVPVSQKQYDALVSMAWNLPSAARHVIDKLNRGEPLTAQDFQRSATIGGAPNRGLSERRTAEAEAFTRGTP